MSTPENQNSGWLMLLAIGVVAIWPGMLIVVLPAAVIFAIVRLLVKIEANTSQRSEETTK